MPSDRIAQCLHDITTAIDLILTWTGEAGGAEESLLRNPLVRSGVERQILVISEAANRLHKLDPLVAPRLAPNIDWAAIRGVGNFIRHKYDDLDSTILVDVVANRLESLREASKQALVQIGTPPNSK